MLRYNRLRLCELCGTRFIDDEHKDEHLNTCPKLPTFDEAESFDGEPPGKCTPPRSSRRPCVDAYPKRVPYKVS